MGEKGEGEYNELQCIWGHRATVRVRQVSDKDDTLKPVIP
jgi:hypothetical protein